MRHILNWEGFKQAAAQAGKIVEELYINVMPEPRDLKSFAAFSLKPQELFATICSLIEYFFNHHGHHKIFRQLNCGPIPRIDLHPAPWSYIDLSDPRSDLPHNSNPAKLH